MMTKIEDEVAEQAVGGGSMLGMDAFCPNCAHVYKHYELTPGQTFHCVNCNAKLYWNGRELTVLE